MEDIYGVRCWKVRTGKTPEENLKIVRTKTADGSPTQWATGKRGEYTAVVVNYVKLMRETRAASANLNRFSTTMTTNGVFAFYSKCSKIWRWRPKRITSYTVRWSTSRSRTTPRHCYWHSVGRLRRPSLSSRWPWSAVTRRVRENLRTDHCCCASTWAGATTLFERRTGAAKQ